jgi:AcrR family transcriptional regulator
MGRKREHDAATGQALLDAAESLIGEGGLPALSVRALAARVGSSTRAVYSVFGSKHGLEQALVARAFRLLGAEVEALALTGDPRSDLIAALTQAFRGFVRAHPDLFRLVFLPGATWGQGVSFGEDALAESNRAWEKLFVRIGRAQEAGVLGPSDPWEVALGLNALGTGLAVLELCQLMPDDIAGAVWESSVATFVLGLEARLPAAPPG